MQTQNTLFTIPGGDFWDNDSVFHRAISAMQNGHLDLGYDMLVALRHHIYATQEAQSMMWIVPSIETTLHSIKRLRKVTRANDTSP